MKTLQHSSEQIKYTSYVGQGYEFVIQHTSDAYFYSKPSLARNGKAQSLRKPVGAKKEKAQLL